MVCDRVFRRQLRTNHRIGQIVYDLCNEWVERITPEETHVIFLPFLYGSNVEADAKACFIGLKGWHHKAHILRALYEGVVFSHKMHIERLLAYRDMPKVARITGGAARSEVWCQMFADVLQAPLEVMSGTELGALGAAMCAGVATGHFPSLERASENMVQVVPRFCQILITKPFMRKSTPTIRRRWKRWHRCGSMSNQKNFFRASFTFEG